MKTAVNSPDSARSRRPAEHSSFQSFSSTQSPLFPRNPHFPASSSSNGLHPQSKFLAALAAIIAVLVSFVPMEIEAVEIEVGQMMIARNDGARISLTVRVIEILDNAPQFEIDARLGNPRQVFLNAKLKSYEEFTKLYQNITALDLSKRDEFDGKGGEATFLQFKKNKKTQTYAYYYKKWNHPETCAAINKLLFHVQEQLVPNELKAPEVVVEKGDSDQLRTWKNVQGKSIEAFFVKLEGETITLRKEDGSIFSFSIELLSALSIQQARAIDEKAAQ